MKTQAAFLLALASVYAAPTSTEVDSTATATEADAACMSIHIFGARNTNSGSTTYGLTQPFISDIINAYGKTKADSEYIDYPADGQANPPDAAYTNSVQAGFKAASSQVAAYAKRCPNAKLVLVGYSQGAKVMDDVLCGGGDPKMGINDTSAPVAGYNIKAVLLPGDDRYTSGETFKYGTATHSGFDPRPSTQLSCGKYDSLIRLYCDKEDLFCSNGNSLKVHNGYYNEYGTNALAFVKSKIG